MGETNLENCGEDGTTALFTGGREGIAIVTYYMGSKTKTWTFDELVALLNDGMKYRLLKKAEKLKKELAND
jgi:hypothetical protein